MHLWRTVSLFKNCNIIFLQKYTRNILACWIVRSRMRKHSYNDELKFKKCSITHFFVTICFVVTCSIRPNKSFFFVILRFARTGTCPFCLAWPHCSTFPMLKLWQSQFNWSIDIKHCVSRWSKVEFGLLNSCLRAFHASYK